MGLTWEIYLGLCVAGGDLLRIQFISKVSCLPKTLLCSYQTPAGCQCSVYLNKAACVSMSSSPLKNGYVEVSATFSPHGYQAKTVSFASNNVLNPSPSWGSRGQTYVILNKHESFFYRVGTIRHRYAGMFQRTKSWIRRITRWFVMSWFMDWFPHIMLVAPPSIVAQMRIASYRM